MINLKNLKFRLIFLKMRLGMIGVSFSRDGRLMWINLFFKKWRFKIKKSHFKFLKNYYY